MTRSGAFSVGGGRQPLAGHDYPQTTTAMLQRFRSEVDCRDYLERIRWPDGFACPTCAIRDVPWRSGTGLIACRHCREPVILTHGTPFHSASIPLSRWLQALWEVCDRETIDRATLHSALGPLPGPECDALAATLRSAMGRASAHPLQGRVQLGHSELVLERSVGDGPTQKRWRHRVQLAIVVELSGEEPRAARVRSLRRRDRMAVLHFARLSIGAAAHMAAPGGNHAIQRVTSLIELWLDGQADVDGDSLDALVGEFCFRFERRSQPRGRAFYDLLQACLLPDEAGKRKPAALTG